MLHQRLLWCCAVTVTLISGGVVHAAKPPEKAQLPDENSRAAELVKIGLEAELAGNGESRKLHLQAALDIEPEYAPAHWHLGAVHIGEEWQPVAKAAAAINKSPPYSLYRAKRKELDGSVKRELNLARWCEREGMRDRALFHYSRLLHNPEINESTAQEAVKKLDLVMWDGELRARVEIEEIQRDAVANQAAWKTWEKKFSVWQKEAESANESKRKLAHEQMQAVDDFHVTPLIESHLLTAGDAWALELVGLLAKFPQLPATKALTHTAVLAPSKGVRGAAINALKTRKLHDFVPQLLAGLVPQTKTQFVVRIGNDWSVDICHQAVTEDVKQRVVTAASEQHQSVIADVFGSGAYKAHNVAFLNSVQTTMTAEAIRKMAQAQVEAAIQRLRETEQIAAQKNRLAEISNATFYEALERTTEQKIPREPGAWGSWWTSYNEVTYDKPTAYYVQQYEVPIYRPFVRTVSCFIAGTPVYTESGPQPIETVRPGDRVLSQDPNTGELAFKLVQNVTVRPPSKLRKITLGGSDIVTTLGHPFWVNGIGWTMAKELKPGQQLHSLNGASEIVKVEELAKPDRAYNLVIADFNSYFVGSANVLVHDNLYRQPTLAKVPGLMEAEK